MIAVRELSWCGLALALNLSPCLGASSAKVIGLQGYVQADAQPTAVFGNREQVIVVQISNAAAQSGPLFADFFQVSGELSLPLAAKVRLQDAVNLTGAPTQELHVTIKFPDVKQRAEILVRLSLGTTPMGDLRFDVFPTTLTKELTDLLQPAPDGSVSVVLFGGGRKLHAFLQTAGVRFDDAGLEMPDRLERGRLYLGELAPTKSLVPTQEMLNTAHVAVFAPDPSLPAGIYADRRAAGVFVQVTEPVLDNLSIDPRAQLALLKVIHLLKTQSSPNHAL